MFPRETLDNVWRCFLFVPRGNGATGERPGMLLKILQRTRQTLLPQCGIIRPQIALVPRWRKLVLRFLALHNTSSYIFLPFLPLNQKSHH